MSAIEFSHADWETQVASHNSTCADCRKLGCCVFLFAAYDQSGSRVAARLADTCGYMMEDDGTFTPAVAQHLADRLAVAYPGCEVLVWADPFMPVADRRGQAFEPAAVGGTR